jgi:hypothetical protein
MLIFATPTWAHAQARDAGAASPAEEPLVFTFPAITRDRARLTVNLDEPRAKPSTFKVEVGPKSQSFTKATPPASRTVEVPADPLAFVRFDVGRPGERLEHALALITPNSRPLLIPDACGTWDLATSGASATATCVARERHCPTFTRPMNDRALIQSQCGGGANKFCVPDYRVEVAGEKKQKVRVGVHGEPGKWLPLFGPDKVRRLRIPSGGRCPGVTVETATDNVRLSLGWGQRVLVKVSLDGQISAEDLPPEAPTAAGGGGD